MHVLTYTCTHVSTSTHVSERGRYLLLGWYVHNVSVMIEKMELVHDQHQPTMGMRLSREIMGNSKQASTRRLSRLA